MNTGAITKRYAKALLLYTQENGSGERVCEQVRRMLRDSSALPDRLEPDLERFIALLAERGRKDYLRRILSCFLDLYVESVGLKNVRLITAVPSPGLEERIRESIEKRTGCRVIIETEVDPVLIGGFRVIVNGEMLDASVRHQLSVLQRDFIEKNNRIV
ncbi:MAG: F0F1 ATP synthase subunit delta [Bacteroidales bacterium]|nr:F0F1 ATP synthase subunit delta [Bacteroidales bacterium]